MNELKFFDFSKEPGKVLERDINVKIDKPLISIITSYYNAKDYIMQTANCVFNQTFPYWEWIIVDDCSSKEDQEILEKLKNMDQRIVLYRNAENLNAIKTRDFAIKKATAEFIYILDSDDLIDNTALETSYVAMMTHPKATWVYSNSVGFGSQQYLWCPPFDTDKEKKENLLCCTALIRKQAVLDVGYISPEKGYEDWSLWLRLLANGATPLRMSYYSFWYRRHDKGILSSINSNNASMKKAFKQIRKLAKNVKEKANAIQYPKTDEYISYGAHPKDFDFEMPYIPVEKNQKRILCIFPWLTLGGADKFNLHLLEKLHEEGYEVTIITTIPCEYVWRQKFEEYAKEIFDLTTFLDKNDWPAFISYLIKSRNYDLLFQSNSIQGYYMLPWIKCMYPELPIIDYVHMEEWHWRDGGYPRDSVAVEKYLDYTYTCSAYLIDIMKKDMNKQKDNIDVVYIGTEHDKFDPEITELPKDEKLKKLEGKKKVLFTCRIAEQKRPMLMIEILKNLCKRRNDIGFVVVGDGDMLPDVKEKAQAYGIADNIACLGVKNDVRPYYKLCDLTLICSMIEGLALTTYESLSMGVPVVTADVGGQKELVDSNVGKIVKLYQNPNVDINNYNYSEEEINAYVDAIIEVLDKGDELKKNCRTKILNGFTVENMKTNMLNIIKEKIQSGTNVKAEDIKGDLNLAERINVLFFESDRDEYTNPDAPKLPLKNVIGNKMWKYKFYRDIMNSRNK